MDQARPLAAVVVAYGDPAHLETCLGALSAPPGAVVVVDNGLSAAAKSVAQAHGAAYLQPERNLGFSGGVNTGLHQLSARGPADVLLLNPDAAVSWADVLRLQDFLRSAARRAAASPRLVRPDGTEEPPSWPVPSPRAVWLDALGLSRWSRAPRFLTGAVLLLRWEALQEVGAFDERYFLYAEESDWQLRALRAGWHVDVAPSITAVHLGGATSDSSSVRSEHFHRSARLFARKWYGRPGAALMRAGSVAAAVRRLAVNGGDTRDEAQVALRMQLRRFT